MIYPSFDKKKIGITAVSCGVGDSEDDLDVSISHFQENGFSVIETENVRKSGMVSGEAIDRCNQLDSLVVNSDVGTIITATGGDFCLEMLPYINFTSIKNNPKWIMGASDPTSILYVVTTALDISTMYGMNAKSFSDTPLHDCQYNAIEILKGNIVEQNSFPFACKAGTFSDHKLSVKDEWVTLNGPVNIKGRIIGGCLDVLRNIVGTPYDYTSRFIERYKNDGIIWYFDVFSMSSEEFYLTLFQMNLAGWFKYTKGIIMGRVMFDQTYNDNFGYKEALTKIFGNIPMIMEADIGHVFPKMIIINGSMATINCLNGKGSIKQELV